MQEKKTPCFTHHPKMASPSATKPSVTNNANRPSIGTSSKPSAFTRFKASVSNQWHTHKAVVIGVIVSIVVLLGIGGYYLYQYLYPSTPKPNTNNNNKNDDGGDGGGGGGQNPPSGGGGSDLPPNIPNPLPIKMGGTSSTKALAGSKVMASSSDGKQIVESSVNLSMFEGMRDGTNIQNEFDTSGVKGKLRITWDTYSTEKIVPNIRLATGCFEGLVAKNIEQDSTNAGVLTIYFTHAFSANETYGVVANATHGPCGLACGKGNDGPIAYQVIVFDTYTPNGDPTPSPTTDMQLTSIKIGILNGSGGYGLPNNLNLLIF